MALRTSLGSRPGLGLPSRAGSLCGRAGVLAFIFAIAAAAGLAADSKVGTPGDRDAAARQALDARVQRLIEQLGDPQYAVRERAQSELKRLGLTAFDALYEAQNHDDIEISLRAQYLVRSLTVDWAREDDPIEVKHILRGYGDKKEKQRKTLMDQLASLPDHLGAEALARLARFERSPVLSKQAALLVMGQPFPDDPERRARLAQRIDQTMDLSKRPAAHWLRIYARTLRDPEGALDEWTQVIAQEQRLLDESPGQTNRQLVLDLRRWQAELLLELGRKSEAEEAMRQAAALVQGAREQILEMVDWLMAHQAWPLVDEIAARYADLFHKDALLTYRLAEAQLKRGQKDLAEQTARRAFELPNENMTERAESAYRLHQSRGLIDWAEREYRYVLEKEPLVSTTGLRARQRLAEMLHDHERDLEAANVYKPVAEALDKDPNLARGVAQARYDPAAIRSRMHYFLAEHARRQGDKLTQIAELERALQHDPEEADALIALYRATQGDPERHEQARRRVEAAANSFREQILQYRQYLDRVGGGAGGAREQGEFLLAMYDNQYAWLVANTFGDFQDALRASHESLKLRPNEGAYLDTLAHCYAALGDYENAVKYQTQAVEQEPHAAQIVRKLAVFQKAWEASKK